MSVEPKYESKSLALTTRKKAFFNRLFPDTGLPEFEGIEADYHLLGLLFVLAFDEEVRESTFPNNAPVTTTLLFQTYPELLRNRITDQHVVAMANYREAFRGMKAAWGALSNYNPEPCPSRAAIKAVIVLTQTLPGSLQPLPV